MDRLVNIAQRLSAGDTIKINAMDALRRTGHQGLKAFLQLFAEDPL